MSVYGPRSELDLLAVQRDDEALDELARRQPRAPMDEDVLFLLAALTTDVDEGLKELLAKPMRMPLRSAATGEIPKLTDAARRQTARTVTGALIVAGLVSVSGVSAAVTGDPFTPYRSVISSVTGDDKRRAGVEWGRARGRAAAVPVDRRRDRGRPARPRDGRDPADAQPAGREAARGPARRDRAARSPGGEARPGGGPGRQEGGRHATPDDPAVTGGSKGDGFVPPGQVKKPVDKPKPKAKPTKPRRRRRSRRAARRSSDAATRATAESRPKATAKRRPSPRADKASRR